MSSDAALRLIISLEDRASRDLKKVAGNFDDLGDKADKAQTKTDSFANKALKGALVGAAIVGVAALGGLAASALSAAAGFEQGMSNIKAVSGATADEMKQISGLALQLGKDTSFSASAASAGIEELIKGGVRISDVMGGAAQSTLNLAAAGGVELAEAAEIAANALSMFNLKGADMAMVSNQIAGAANASSLSVTDFKFSLAAAGSVLAASSQSFESTATAIALMGAAGIKGQDAGTSLKSMFNSLIPTTDKATGAMEQLGIITADGANKFLNANGTFKQAGEVAGVLEDALAGATDAQRALALETIFGADGMRAAIVLTKAGAKGFDDMAVSMGKVTAASVAAERLNNLRGDLETLKGSLETAGIVGGTVLIPMLRDLTQWGTKTVNAAIPLIEAYGPAFARGVGTTARVIGGVLVPALEAAAAATAVWALGALPGQIGAVAAATRVWAASLSTLTVAAGAVGIAVALVVVAHQRFQQQIDLAIEKALDLDRTLQANTRSLDAFTMSQSAQTAGGKLLIENLSDLEGQYSAVAREIEEVIRTTEAHAGSIGLNPAQALAGVEPRLRALRDLQGDLAQRLAATRNEMVELNQATDSFASDSNTQAVNDRAAAYAKFATSVEGGARALGVQLVDGLGKAQEAASLTVEEIGKLEEALGNAALKGAESLGSLTNVTVGFHHDQKALQEAHEAAIAQIIADAGGAKAAAVSEAAQKALAAENAGYATSLQNANLAYANEAAAHRAHLGEMLIETVNSWLLMGKVPAERAAEMNAALAQEYGITANNSQLLFGQMAGHLLNWRDTSTVTTGDVILSLHNVETGAVTAAQQMDALAKVYEMELRHNLAEGKMSVEDFDRALALIPSQISLVVNTNLAAVRDLANDAKRAVDSIPTHKTVTVDAHIAAAIHHQSPSPIEITMAAIDEFTSRKHVIDVDVGSGLVWAVSKLFTGGFYQVGRLVVDALVGGYVGAPTQLSNAVQVDLDKVLDAMRKMAESVQLDRPGIVAAMELMAQGAGGAAEAMRTAVEAQLATMVASARAAASAMAGIYGGFASRGPTWDTTGQEGTTFGVPFNPHRMAPPGYYDNETTFPADPDRDRRGRPNGESGRTSTFPEDPDRDRRSAPANDMSAKTTNQFTFYFPPGTPREHADEFLDLIQAKGL